VEFVLFVCGHVQSVSTQGVTDSNVSVVRGILFLECYILGCHSEKNE
jgi:hypothetical protein